MSDPAHQSPSEAEPRIHTVQPGDTLFKIAEAMYGDGHAYPAIFEANRDVLADPHVIQPGQKLRIPERVVGKGADWRDGIVETVRGRAGGMGEQDKQELAQRLLDALGLNAVISRASESPRASKTGGGVPSR